jgi:hypothetical protein
LPNYRPYVGANGLIEDSLRLGRFAEERMLTFQSCLQTTLDLPGLNGINPLKPSGNL